MISNADIWLKECDVELINLIKTNQNIGYALTRHEYDMSCPLIDIFSPQQMSFDSFIFKSPIYIDLKLINHQQNRMGSENVFKRELENIGIVFYNPCKDIVIVHEHKSEIRNYGEDMLFAPGKKVKWIYNKKLIYSPVISKKQLIITGFIQPSGKKFKSTFARLLRR